MHNVASVLVVDDSPIDRRLAGRLIDKCDNLVAAYAESGPEALAVMAQVEPRIVVTDLLMPEMDGLELVAEVRKKHPLVPVVIMTGHGNEETAVKALAAGAASYVPKRILAEELTDTIESVLEIARGARDEHRLYELMAQAELTFELSNNPEDMSPVLRHLEGLVNRLGLCEEGESIQIGVALREAIVNAVDHGNLELDSALKEEGAGVYEDLAGARRAGEPYCDRKVYIRAVLGNDQIRYIVRDDGHGFDPQTVPSSAEVINLDHVYGRGLLLIRTFMDEVSHNTAGNEITMIKRRKTDTSL